VEALRPFLVRQIVQAPVRIDAARRDENKIGVDAPGQLQAVIAAGQIGVDQVFRRAAIAGLRGGLRRALYDQVRRLRQAGEIGQRADIAMRKRHTCFTQPAQVELRSAAMQIVESRHLRLWMAALEGQRDTRSHEAGPPVTRMR
jgi:hypothetical protein